MIILFDLDGTVIDQKTTIPKMLKYSAGEIQYIIFHG